MRELALGVRALGPRPHQEIVVLVTSGELTADIDSTFHLEQYADALSRAEHYQRRGKVLFVFGD
jgi:hypothetical protein